MASPQPDKFTKLSNELLEQVPKFKLNGSQLRMIMIIWRYTYGFGKKEAELSISFLAEAMDMVRRQVTRELSELIRMNVVQVVSEQKGTRSRIIRFNKDYESWKVVEVSKKTTQLELFSGDELDTTGMTNQTPLEGSSGDELDTQKRKYLKKGFKEKEIMFETFYSLYPRKANKAYAEKTWSKFCKKEEFDPDIVIDYTFNFVETCNLLNTETKFIPHASTYLNQERWKDYPIVDPEGLAQNGNDKLSDNLNFLKNHIGGADGDGARSQLNPGKGLRGLPEQCPEP
ncbi:replication protein [Paenibacillus sp. FSL R5-0407]|uniref:replication protein n=1 Tax=Paenibacillus sp. FSL R5-0407 TaxID=2975320 RepID=UPI0030FC9821